MLRGREGALKKLNSLLPEPTFIIDVDDLVGMKKVGTNTSRRRENDNSIDTA